MAITIRWLQKEKLSRIKAKGNRDMRTFTIFLVLVLAAWYLHVNAQTRGVISAKTQELYLDYSHLYETKDVPVIQWENPIKQLGAHQVTLRLSGDVVADFQVVVESIDPIEATEEPAEGEELSTEETIEAETPEPVEE